MNTKFTGHHISSGGFIFYKDKRTKVLYTLLIKNKKNEYWIPKGHIEDGEDQATAAFREIEEEVGLNKNKLTYIDFCHLYKFSFTDEAGNLNTKEVYMNVFEADKRHKPRIEPGETDISGAEWFKYSEALEKIIPFSKNELIKAKKIFENHLNKDFENARKDLSIQSFAKDLVCFIVFGSSVVNANTGKVPDDVDICIVANNRKADLHQISEFIFTYFKNPDFRIYFQDEIDSDLQFMDVGVGVFSMEYFADGIVLFGRNIFIEKLPKIDKTKLKESYLNKIFEYILRIRVVYISKNSTYEYKMWHIHKYVIRLSIDILLYNGSIAYSDLKKITKYEIFNLCKDYGILKKETIIDFDNLENMYKLFQEINLYVVDSHSNKFL